MARQTTILATRDPAIADIPKDRDARLRRTPKHSAGRMPVELAGQHGTTDDTIRCPRMIYRRSMNARRNRIARSFLTLLRIVESLVESWLAANAQSEY